MKKFLKNIIYFLIEIIEKYEYRNLEKNEDDILKKIINTIFLKKDMLVETDYGYVPFSEISITQPFQRYRLELENGLWIEGADDHIVFCENHIPKKLIDLTEHDYILTKRGLSKVKFIDKLHSKISMFDLSIDTPEMSYYTNEILSHNTVSAAIVILHTAIFNDDKGIMIVANKFETVKEIIRKIKDIYRLLPFFLKSGVANWNEKQLSFENNSRIQGQARSKEPAIGFAIDLLYLDEFAKVPDNIIRTYYGSVVPTVSSIENSKIIITSTPEGYNLFWEILTKAELPKDDPNWNKYAAMRIYWWQVKGRRDVKLLFFENKLKSYNLELDYVINKLVSMGYNIESHQIDNDIWYNIKFFQDDEKTPYPNASIDDIRQLRIDDVIPLPELCRITNWEEEQTNLIGGKSLFKQEYEIQFITDDKLLFDSVMFETFMNERCEFETPYLENFEKKLNIPYSNLKFVKDKPDLFEIQKAKDYYIVISIDLAEGLGLDYSVINIFRLKMKDEKVIDFKKDFYTNKYDLFKLDQIGMFRNNVYSINEMAHILYLIVFELFDPEKVKIVLEMNKNLGNDLLNNLRHVFNDNNDFSDGVFVRYKHRESDLKPKVGLIIGHNKKLFLKDFQDAIKKENIILHDDTTILELKSFTKKETPSGEITFRTESGHDDCVMTLIGLSSIFDNYYYKNMVDTYCDYNLNDKEKGVLLKFLNSRDDDSIINYQAFSGAHKRFYPKIKPDMKPISTISPFSQNYENRNPFDRKF